MYKQKIGISIGNDYDISMEKRLQIIKNAGFDAISPVWESKEALVETVNTARGLGLELQSLHAPFGRAADMWSEDPDICTLAKDELTEVAEACALCQIPVLVVHAWIGFDYKFEKDELYFENFDEIVSRAERCGIKIAFENTEGDEYLAALMEHFENNDSVGFCRLGPRNITIEFNIIHFKALQRENLFPRHRREWCDHRPRRRSVFYPHSLPRDRIL